MWVAKWGLVLFALACAEEPVAPTMSKKEAEEQALAVLEASQTKAAETVSVGSDSQVGTGQTQKKVLQKTADGASAVAVLNFTGVGGLYKGFFSDSKAVAALGENLTGSVTSPALVHVRYSEADLAGSIALEVTPSELLLSPGVSEKGNVVLQDLAPALAALAKYRSAIAGRFDLRVDTFKILLLASKGSHVCVLGAAGPMPPDGSLVSPCVEVDGSEVCGNAAADGVQFPEESQRIIQQCLGI